MKHEQKAAPDPARAPEEAARQLNLHVETVRQHLRAGLIPGVRIGGAWRIKQSTIDAILAGDLQAAK
jgi:excisionase family DNA binding protein